MFTTSPKNAVFHSPATADRNLDPDWTDSSTKLRSMTLFSTEAFNKKRLGWVLWKWGVCLSRIQGWRPAYCLIWRKYTTCTSTAAGSFPCGINKEPTGVSLCVCVCLWTLVCLAQTAYKDLYVIFWKPEWATIAWADVCLRDFLGLDTCGWVCVHVWDNGVVCVCTSARQAWAYPLRLNPLGFYLSFFLCHSLLSI